MRSKIILLLALITIFLTACAPDNLDITPTAAPTDTPPPTATRAPTPVGSDTGTTEATEEAARGLLDQLVAAAPDRLPAGSLTFNRTRDEVVQTEVDGGTTARLNYSESGGSSAEITFGVFDTPEAAQAFYDTVLGRVRTLENATTRDDVPQPNAFGGGTYGSDAIILRDNIYIRVSIPQFSSTAGNPLAPMARSVNEFVDQVIGTSS